VGSRAETPVRKAETAEPHADPTRPITKKPPMKATTRPADQEKVEKKAQAGKK
jgi:hypothetical protein